MSISPFAGQIHRLARRALDRTQKAGQYPSAFTPVTFGNARRLEMVITWPSAGRNAFRLSIREDHHFPLGSRVGVIRTTPLPTDVFCGRFSSTSPVPNCAGPPG